MAAGLGRRVIGRLVGAGRAICTLLAMVPLLVLASAPAALALPPAAPPAPVGWRPPLPAPLRVTQPFTPPTTRYGRGHRGVDLAAPPGTPVLAAGAGVVGYAGLLAGRGVVTVLHADGLRTTYEPVDPVVTVGERVSAGQVIGRLAWGHAGCAAAACLHWGLLRGSDYLDPMRLLGAGPVRLLPFWGVPPGGQPRQIAVGAVGRPTTAATVSDGQRPRPSRPAGAPGLRLATAQTLGAAALGAALLAGLALAGTRERGPARRSSLDH